MSDKSDSEASLSLGRETPEKEPLPRGYLEITLNYPRTVSFLKMSSVKQKILYIKIWSHVRATLNHPDVIMRHSDYEFEYCKTGQIHLHGYIPVYTEKYFIEGIISDVVKRYLEGLPKKHSKFNEKNMYPEFHRYKSPSICVQHDNMSDPVESDRFDRWKKYMIKIKTNN